MPRKAKKTEKPPLLFLEQPSSGSKIKAVPEVRAALNPRHFFTEETKASSSRLQGWVSPQFNRTALAVPPARQGQRRFQSAASVLDGCTQPSRKTSVCKFPALSFETRPRALRTKTATQRAAEGGHDAKTTASGVNCFDEPSNWTGGTRCETDSSSISDRHIDQAVNTCRTPADGPSSPPGGAGPLPDVDTPHIPREDRSPPQASIRLLLEQPLSLPGGQPPHTLVADTPERDYGLKVTWRRRKAMMSLLREGGHLSECDTLVQKTKLDTGNVTSVSKPFPWRMNT